MKRKVAVSLRLRLFVLLSLTSFLIMLNAVVLKGEEHSVGAVYTMTNDPAGNAVLVFNRFENGTLAPAGTFLTGGLGTGGREPDFGLGNAGALALSENDRFLFVVNPGSDDLSVFAVEKNGLTLLDRKSSGGHQPISVTVNMDVVYVLNAGGNVGSSDNITGFTVSPHGKLSHLSNSTRPLSAGVTAPSQILFSPKGKVLVVTEKATNVIDTYTVDRNGRATGPNIIAADAQTPFGIDIDRNRLFVADDFNDAPSAGALSSYLVSDNGNLQLVSSAVASNESGACWVVVSKDGRDVYVANTVSSAISIYSIANHSGRVIFDTAVQSTAGPTDMQFSRDGRFLYALAPDQLGQTSPGINFFGRDPRDGGLVPLSRVSGLPASVDGLAAR